MKHFNYFLTEWCASDVEESNRTRSNSEKSDSDTSHIEETVEHDSDDDEIYDENGVITSPDGKGDTSLGLRKRRKRYEANGQSFEESTPVETCYTLRLEEDFAHVIINISSLLLFNLL